jgi:glycosyltransferase involved in cell wall biosynthesis
MLADGLAGRGVAVTAAGPSSAGARLAFSAVPGVAFAAVEIGDRPRPGDLASILRLRRLLSARADVVHAHGLRAGALSLLALTLVRGARRPAAVVTVHNAPPAAAGTPALVYRLLERLVAQRADLVLCVSPDLEARMRGAGAHRVERAVIAATEAPFAQPGTPAAVAVPLAPLALGGPAARPVVLSAGRLAPQKGFGVLLEAAAALGDLDPVPLVVIAGDGPLGAELPARAAALGVDAVFAGHRDDVPALLALAAVFVLPSLWEGQPLVLQEALRAGTPVVATRAGGIPGLAGDAALLVPPGDAPALAAAVRSVLTDPLLAAALRVAAASRAAVLPSPADAVDAALAAYSALGR